MPRRTSKLASTAALALGLMGCEAGLVDVAPVPVPVQHQVQGEEFTLTLASAQTEYRAGEPMQIEARLTYVG